MRLARYIAACGVCSRREAGELIKHGTIIVNGEQVTDLSFEVDPNVHRVYKGRRRLILSKTEIWALNKPPGFEVSKKPFAYRSVYELLPTLLKSFFPVGRLDVNTEGLLLFTNNGALARFLESPKNRFRRIYSVEAYNNLEFQADRLVASSNKTISIKGKRYAIDSVKLIRASAGEFFFEIAISEGRNREIRNILSAFGFKIKKIKRKRYGPFSLMGIASGHIRKLDAKHALDEMEKSEKILNANTNKN